MATLAPPAPKKGALARPKTVEAAIAAATKKYGIRIGPLSTAQVDIESLSTGDIGLDLITGVGGFPRGRLIELYGPPSSGKTTAALKAAAYAQQERNLNVAFFDHEQAIDPEYCRALGLDTDAESFTYCQPDFLEMGGNISRMLIGTGDYGIAIFDSVAAMIPETELLGETGKRSVGEQARLMSQLCKQLIPLAASTNTLIIFLNHVQDVIDASGMGQKLAAAGVQRKTTPGGKALKFYASMRIEFKPIGGVRRSEKDQITGEAVDVVAQNKIKASVVKNKVASPFKECELRAIFGRGFSPSFNALNVITSHKLGISVEAGGVYRFKDQNLAPKSMDVSTKQNWIRGELSILEQADTDPEWLARLTAKAREQLFSGPKEDAPPVVLEMPTENEDFDVEDGTPETRNPEDDMPADADIDSILS